VVDAFDAVGFEFLDFAGGDGAATAAEDGDVADAFVIEAVDEVAEVFVVAALVGGDGDGVGVFLDGGADDVVDAAVVAEVDDFGAFCWMRRRMMLMAASWPSNRDVEVMKRSGVFILSLACLLCAGPGVGTLFRDRCEPIPGRSRFVILTKSVPEQGPHSRAHDCVGVRQSRSLPERTAPLLGFRTSSSPPHKIGNCFQFEGE